MGKNRFYGESVIRFESDRNWLSFLPLGLNTDDEFWSGPDLDWTSKAIWKGVNLKTDHAIGD